MAPKINNSGTTPRNTMSACNALLQSILQSIDRFADNSPPASTNHDLNNSLQTLNETMQILANNMVTLNANITKIADSLPLMENINTNITSLTSHLASTAMNLSNITPPPPTTPPVPISVTPINPQPSHSRDYNNIPDSNILTPEQDALNIRNSISPIWNKKSSDHSRHTWQKIRNHNTSNTYSIWMDNSPIIIPNDFKIKPIQGEPDNQREIRERTAKMNFANEIELLILRSESHDVKLTQIDSEMKELIAQKSSGPTRDILLNMWNEKTRSHEENALKRWRDKNQKWLQKFENDTSSSNSNPFMQDTQSTRNNQSYRPHIPPLFPLNDTPIRQFPPSSNTARPHQKFNTSFTIPPPPPPLQSDLHFPPLNYNNHAHFNSYQQSPHGSHIHNPHHFLPNATNTIPPH